MQYECNRQIILRVKAEISIFSILGLRYLFILHTTICNPVDFYYFIINETSI